MAKLNSIGVKARDIDRIIDKAIRRIGKGEDRYSCCALIETGNLEGCWKVRKAYTNAFSPVSKFVDHYGCVFAETVNQATTRETAADFRVLMLSLFRAAWRDLT